MVEIACFISPHGYGHATRTIAILEALQSLQPQLHIHLVTTVPQALFDKTSLTFSYHPFITDVGLIQQDGFTIDLPGTIAALRQFLPFQTETVQQLQDICSASNLILADISVLGIHVAKQCRVPSVIVENFTWDWIYAHFNKTPELLSYARVFKQLYAQADYRIQAEPVCLELPGSFRCHPVARAASSDPARLKKRFKREGRIRAQRRPRRRVLIASV